MSGRPKRKMREARVRAQLGLPQKPPGQRAMNASELAMLKMRYERDQTTRVERHLKLGHNFRAWAIKLPRNIPWSVIGFVLGVGAGCLVYKMGVSQGWSVIVCACVSLVFLVFEMRTPYKFADDEKFNDED